MQLWNLIRLLQQRNVQPSRNVPRQMAMEDVDGRIVQIDLQDRVRPHAVRASGRCEELDVSAQGVGRVGDCAVPVAVAFC